MERARSTGVAVFNGKNLTTSTNRLENRLGKRDYPKVLPGQVGDRYVKKKPSSIRVKTG